jgi:hypothetical protein
MSDQSSFAKLYETERGQVLVMLKEGDEGGPEIRFFVQPEGLGVCSVALSWDDGTEESWAKADAAFERMNEAAALKSVAPIYRLTEGKEGSAT